MRTNLNPTSIIHFWSHTHTHTINIRPQSCGQINLNSCLMSFCSRFTFLVTDGGGCASLSFIISERSVSNGPVNTMNMFSNCHTEKHTFPSRICATCKTELSFACTIPTCEAQNHRRMHVHQETKKKAPEEQEWNRRCHAMLWYWPPSHHTNGTWEIMMGNGRLGNGWLLDWKRASIAFNGEVQVGPSQTDRYAMSGQLSFAPLYENQHPLNPVSDE